jgi:CRISPR-associated endoribonuclease Cas6
MEIKLSFRNPGSNTSIPIDYQYYLASWVYSVIKSGDEQYATFLHEQGYKPHESSNKLFKLFCFSNLLVDSYSIQKHRSLLTIHDDVFHLRMRFKVDETLENFIKGIFTDQRLTLKSSFNEMVHFDITSVETTRLTIPEDKARIRTLSPIFLSKIVDNNTKYLSPEDKEFENTLFQNLLDKYIAAGGTIPQEWTNATQKISLPPYVKIRSKKNDIKKGSDRPIEVKSYTFDFDIEAPKELIEIGLLAGFGRDNAMGFGYGEVIG